MDLVSYLIRQFDKCHSACMEIFNSVKTTPIFLDNL